MCMRGAVFLTTLLLFSLIPIYEDARGLEVSDGIVMTAQFDESNETTKIMIYVPITNDAALLDELKQASFVVTRAAHGTPSEWDAVLSGVKLCDESMTNGECSGLIHEFEYYPEAMETSLPTNPSIVYNLLVEQDLPVETIVSTACCVYENVSATNSVDNLTATYSNGITTLSWDYPDSTPMNHTVVVYSHSTQATAENWDSLSKTLISSSISSGTTTYEINHSGSNVERKIFYTVTLLYDTSEDTRFFTDNTLTEPVWEDNTPPLFIGELSAIYDPVSQTTTIDWEEGVQDDDLMINIYRSNVETSLIDTSTLVASVDASLSSYQVQVPLGEHRQSWYAITLQDSEGNEILTLTPASPVFGPVIETTLDPTTVTGVSGERYGDGTVVITWDDNTNNPDAVARIWRSFSGPIESLQDAEELLSVNVSNEQFAHNPLNPNDEAWYAVTIDGAWGAEEDIWHDERLFLGVNSMSNPIRETEEVLEETEANFSAHVLTTSGIRASITDGTMISLGDLNQNDLIVISTSYPVTNITCYDISGQGTSISSGEDWALSFNANQSGEECGGLISDDGEEITFSLSWNYVEVEVIANDDDDDDRDDDDDDDDDRDDDDDDDHRKDRDHDDDGKEIAATAILSILILALIIYLVVMMKKQDYTEEE